MPPSHGLSTLEILIACALIALLVVISLPGYGDQARQVRRAEAWTALLEIQQAQELHRSRHSRYAASLTELQLTELTEGGHYRLSTSTDPETASTRYLATAVAQQGQAADTVCRHLALERQAGRTLERSGASADLANDVAHNRLCWRP